MTRLHDLTALEQAAAIRSGELSPLELTDHYLDRIERLNERVGAFVTVTADRARRQAGEAARRVQECAERRLLPPLHGVAVPVKDLSSVRGVRLTRGSAACADLVGSVDDAVVTRLRRALTGVPLPRAAGGRLVLAVDVSPWLRPDAGTVPDRSFCHTYGRGGAKHQMMPGWPYPVVLAAERPQARDPGTPEPPQGLDVLLQLRHPDRRDALGRHRLGHHPVAQSQVDLALDDPDLLMDRRGAMARVVGHARAGRENHLDELDGGRESGSREVAAHVAAVRIAPDALIGAPRERRGALAVSLGEEGRKRHAQSRGQLVEHRRRRAALAPFDQ